MFHKEGFKIILVTFILVTTVVLLTKNFITMEWLQYLIYAVALV
ncbi:MAG TPA: phosphatidylserine decarboxylase family protein, partial [Flavobacteriaceae bacterium]|nr:phosphatidylserine decarboxylase family protein [Flavobacteriaceae bacterium]